MKIIITGRLKHNITPDDFATALKHADCVVVMHKCTGIYSSNMEYEIECEDADIVKHIAEHYFIEWEIE